MRCRLARRRHTIMATRAGAQHCIMVDPGDGYPADGRMTSFTVIRGGDVLRVFTCRFDAIMATGTAISDSIMGEAGGRPVYGRMTGVAIAASGDMIRRFADCGHAIMTTGTPSGDRIVINPTHRTPAQGGMT